MNHYKKNGPHEIYSSQFPMEMSDWLSQKTSKLLTFLVRTRAILQNSSLKDEEKNNLIHELEVIITDVVKVFSFSVGSQWNRHDAEIIISDGEHGLILLRERYKKRWFE